MITRFPPVTEREYPPLKTPVTWRVMVPEAVPLLSGLPISRYPPATLVRVIVWPEVSWTEVCLRSFWFWRSC